ncbi:hypothetical protein TNCV_2934841 [Trichonephila clavipes]|nr:hypothetical protein TNCV_2934841 [Trichonephila clavipes]
MPTMIRYLDHLVPQPQVRRQKLSVNFNNNGAFDMNFITQTLQQTILALSMLTQHIGNITSLPPPPQPLQSKKSKSKEQRKKELHALFEALIEYEDD